MVGVAKKAPMGDRLERELGSEFELHKNDETSYGSGSDLPAGINGGVAQLVEAKIDEYKDGDNKGKLYLYLGGTVKSPAEVKGTPVQGLRAQKMFKLFAHKSGPKDISKSDALAKALNAVRQMGGITGDIRAKDLPILLDALKEEAPHFRFRTYSFASEGQDDPMVVTELRGKIDDYTDNGAPSGAINDQTGEPADGGQAQGTEENWDAILVSANGDDGDAQTKLRETCKAMGMSGQEVEDAPDWEALVTYIRSGGSAAGGEGEGTGSEDWKPDVKDEVTIKLKGMKSAQKLTITKVNKTTMDLRNENTKKDFKGLKWTANPAAIDGVEL